MQVETEFASRTEQKSVIDYFASGICMGSSHWVFSGILDNCCLCPDHFCHCIMISIHRTELWQQSDTSFLTVIK